MKLVTTKNILTALLFGFTMTFLQAQPDMGAEINKIGKQVIGTFAVLAVLGLVGVFVWQWPNLASKNGDSKQAFVAIAVYFAIILLIVGIAGYVKTINLI